MNMQYGNNLNTEKKTLSMFGVSSIIVGIISGLSMLLIFGIVTYVAINEPRDLENNEVFLAIIGFSAIGVILLNILGTGLGIGGLFQNNHKKIFQIVGIILNALQLLILVGLIIAGLIIE